MEHSMTAVEMDRLRQWLQTKGLTAEEILECLAYIAHPSAPDK